MNDIRKYVRLVEASELNIALLRMLTNMFIDSIDSSILKQIKEKEADGIKYNIIISEPYSKYYNTHKLYNFMVDNNIPNYVQILDNIETLKFVYDNQQYRFDDNEGSTIDAAASYNSINNVITFYDSRSITDYKVIAHELRHAIQYYSYETKRKKNKKEKDIPYFKKPIEIDAYWHERLVDLVLKNDIPYSDEKDKIRDLINKVFNDFISTVRNNLDGKLKNHYYRKTAKAIIAIVNKSESGMAPTIHYIRNVLNDISNESNKKLLDLLDKDSSDEEIKSAINMKSVSINSIPDFDGSKEPIHSVYSDELGLPYKISTNMSEAAMVHALLYFAIRDLRDTAMMFKKFLEKNNIDIAQMVDDFLLKEIHDIDNQGAIVRFLNNYYEF